MIDVKLPLISEIGQSYVVYHETYGYYGIPLSFSKSLSHATLFPDIKMAKSFISRNGFRSEFTTKLRGSKVRKVIVCLDD